MFTALFAQGEAIGEDVDWMLSVPLQQSSAQIRPADGAEVQQTPPDFGWPDLGLGTQYRFSLTYPDGSSRTLDTPHNWLNWDEVLAAGSYSWLVEATDGSGTRVSRSRSFMVAASAEPFLVPHTDALLQSAAAKPHPRALPQPEELQLMLATRQAGLAELLRLVDAAASDAAEPEPVGDVEAEIEAQAFAAIERTMNALFAFVATGSDAHYAQALQRALDIAAWDPHGRTSYALVDEPARGIASTLAVAYDWLFPRLDELQKAALLTPLEVRLREISADVGGTRSRLAAHPHDSHGHHTLTFLAAISTMLVGDVPEADEWLRGSLPLALNLTSPWGGEDGGFATGTAYAQWITGDQLLAWYALEWTVGVDVAQKAWTRNHSRFLAYFLPPGTPTGAFGDGAELPPDEHWARFGKAFVLFAPTALGRWYAAQLEGEDPSRLHLLLAPRGDEAPAPLPPGTPSSALFPSIGWAALHSDLADRDRTSVYFKSSPYGSFNHSHADQLSFVINAGGQALAIDSGYFDGYDSEHWRGWYKQSRAHNVVTFDGGQGQVVFEESGQVGAGVVTLFDDGPSFSAVWGDATQAYGGALTKAQRLLVYVRPDLVVVRDELAADIPRRWEWNIHARERMQPLADGRIEIQSGEQRLCVAMLEGPPTVFQQHDGFSVAPLDPQSPPQWHGAFVATQPSTTAEFLVSLSIGCQP
ncbi:MAG TPA: heparinase II/III family protein [Gammaproteobacteria bacterium]|nr:heparinase II/III family protein [Gammaproteobacteria bacterium]